jgi:hypothetical protein
MIVTTCLIRGLLFVMINPKTRVLSEALLLIKLLPLILQILFLLIKVGLFSPCALA